jgi:hypothetical protein
MHTDTGRTPSEWVAIHEEAFRALNAMKSRATIGSAADLIDRRLAEEGLAIAYWRTVRRRVQAGIREPLPLESVLRSEWRRAVERSA